MAKSDVEKETVLPVSKSKPKETAEDVARSLYFCGRRFVVLGEKASPANCRETGLGKYGFETVTMRIPKPLVPFIKSILAKCAEIERTRQIILTNVFNTSPDFLMLQGMEKRISETEESTAHGSAKTNY